MKSVSEALEIRSSILRRFEDLCRFEDETKLSITVVGGGPTGVEMAGAIAELKKGPLHSDQAKAAAHIQVNLVEAGPRILPSFSEKLSARTQRDLEKLEVRILTNTSVKEVKPREIILGDRNKLPSEVTIWAAGVSGVPIMKKLGLPTANGRITVGETMQVANYPHIFAIGDIAGAKGKDGRFLPMVAPVAMQQARFVAKQIARLQSGKPPATFKYRDKGSMATIGRHKAVVEVGPLRMSGIPAWYAWLWLHLFYLLGGRNKIGTMADWTWNYLTFDRGNRHIMDIS
jgi:NADH dehydrogenase